MHVRASCVRRIQQFWRERAREKEERERGGGGKEVLNASARWKVESDGGMRLTQRGSARLPFTLCHFDKEIHIVERSVIPYCIHQASVYHNPTVIRKRATILAILFMICRWQGLKTRTYGRRR